MPETIADLVIKLSLDDQKLRASAQTSTALNTSIAKIASSAKTAATELKNVQKSTSGMDAFWNRLAKEADRATTSTDKLKDSLEQVARAQQQAQSQAGNLVGSGGMAVTAVGRLVGGGLGQALNSVGDVGDVIEVVSRLKDSLKNLSKEGFGSILSIVGPGAALAVGMVALTAVFDSFNKAVEEQKKKLLQEIELRRQIDKLTSDQARARVEELQSLIKTNEEEMAAAAARMAAIFDEKGVFGSALDASFGGARDAINELRTQNQAYQLEIDALTQGLQDGSTAANDMKIAEQELAQVRSREAQEAVQTVISTQQRYLELQRFLETATAEQVTGRIKANEQERDSLEQLVRQLEQMGTPEALEAARQTRLRIEQLTDSIELLGSAVGEKRLKEGIQGIIDGIRKAAEDAKAAAARIAENIAVEVRERNDRLIAVQREYEDTVKAIEEDSARERADAQQRYNDRIVDIAKDAARAAAQALSDYKKELASIQQDASREDDSAVRRLQVEEAKARVESQRQETKELISHYRELDRIRRDAQRQESDLILRRDFASLFSLREKTGQQLEDTTRGFNEGKTGRERESRERLSDMRRDFEVERQERRIQTQQRLDDARAAYQAELSDATRSRVEALNQARLDRQKDLADAVRSANQARQAARARYTEELRLASLFANQRAQIDARVNAAYLARANATLNALNQMASRSSYQNIPTNILQLTRRANGGDLERGQLSLVNERPGQRESVGGSWLPAGPGLYLPLQRTSVSSGKGGVNAPMTFNVSGSDPERVSDLIARKVYDTLDALMS